MNFRSSLALFASVVCTASLAVPPCAAALPGSTAVARVNGDGITKDALTTYLLTYYGRNGLEELINRSVLRQDLAARKLAVTDAEVDTRVAEMTKAGGAELADNLRNGNITEDAIREQARYALIAEKVLAAKWPVKDEDLTRLSLRYVLVQTQAAAKEVITDAKRGVSFDLLVTRSSEGREDLGLVQPDPFFRIDKPNFFKAAMDANLYRPGQVSQQPIPSGRFWLVLKLERKLGPETLRGKEREDAIRRINAVRFPSLIPSARKHYRIVTDTGVDKLIADPKMSGDTVVAHVGEQTVTRKDLIAYLTEYYGKGALAQLVERSLVQHEAAQSNVGVSPAEVDARVEAVKKPNPSAFQSALVTEGITEDAWKERVHYTMLAERVVQARAPLRPSDFDRLTVRYIRVANRQDAEQMIQAAGMGTKWEQLAAARTSLDRTGDGFLKPKLFLEAENPEIFKTIDKARLKPGEVLPTPVEAGGTYLVLRLEGRFGPETLTGKERDDAVRRINGLRMGPLLDAWRKEFKIDYPVPIKTLVADARA
jgi:parvulin-like peptidyl-prolyl isomerase